MSKRKQLGYCLSGLVKALRPKNHLWCVWGGQSHRNPERSSSTQWTVFDFNSFKDSTLYISIFYCSSLWWSYWPPSVSVQLWMDNIFYCSSLWRSYSPPSVSVQLWMDNIFYCSSLWRSYSPPSVSEQLWMDNMLTTSIKFSFTLEWTVKKNLTQGTASKRCTLSSWITWVSANFLLLFASDPMYVRLFSTCLYIIYIYIYIYCIYIYIYI